MSGIVDGGEVCAAVWYCLQFEIVLDVVCNVLLSLSESSWW